MACLLSCFGFGVDETEEKKKSNLNKKNSDVNKKNSGEKKVPVVRSDMDIIIPVPVVRSDTDSLSLGIEVTGGKMYVFIPVNTKIPIKLEKFFEFAKDFHTEMEINVYEGESTLAMENVFLKRIEMLGLPPAPKGVTKLKICFDIDVNGTLKVSAQDMLSSELRQEITITSDQRRSAKMLNAKKTLEDYTNNVKLTICDAKYEGKLKQGEKEKIMKVANEAIEWLNENQSAKVYEYVDKRKEFEVLWNPIITKLYEDAAAATTPSPPQKVVPEYSCSPRASDAPKAGSLLEQVD